MERGAGTDAGADEGTDMGLTADARADAGRRRVDPTGRIQYAVAAALAFGAVTIALQPWRFGHDAIFPSGNDFVWQQAVFQMHADGGIWGATSHLSFPIGANAWRLPQFSMLAGIWAWVTVGWFGLGTAASILLFLALGAALNAAAIVYLLRSLGAGRHGIFVVAMATAVGGGSYVTGHQINLGVLFIFPLTFAFIWRWCAAREAPRPGQVVVLAVAATMSCLWWMVTIVLAVPLLVVPFVVRRDWRSIRAVATASSALIVGFGIQTLLFLIASSQGPGADTEREPWVSLDAFGHLADVIAGSPIVRSIAPGLIERIRPGLSLELATGTPIVIMASVAVLALLARPPGTDRRGHDTTAFTTLTVVFILYFLGGGLGGLQATVAVILGTVSPARSWYRMIVPIAILGVAWVAIILGRLESRPHRSPRFGVWIASGSLVVLALGWVDLAAEPTLPNSRAKHERDEAAMTFIAERSAPCPIAQFPDESLPNGQVTLSVVDPGLYRSMVPYVVLPEFSWSAGAYDPDAPSGIGRLPPRVSDDDLDAIRSLGFCGVLYDKLLGRRAVEQRTDMPGRVVDFSRPPDFEDRIWAYWHLADDD